jgi:hypothetical protein
MSRAIAPAISPDGRLVGFVTVQRLPLEDAAIIYVQNWASEFRQLQ